MIKKLLFKIAKGFFMGKIVGNAFRYCSWAIPVKKVYNDKEILAFYHPRPSYENHMIISPKRAIKNLQQMKSDCFSKYLVKILEVAKDISEAHSEHADSFVIVANGGKRQEVQQVHFHMFTNHEIVNGYSVQKEAGEVFFADKYSCVLGHPNPNWEIHFVMKPMLSFRTVENEEYKYKYYRSVLQSIDLLNVEFNIVQRGYSLVCRCDEQESDVRCPVFHIIAGEKRDKNECVLLCPNKGS